MTLAQQPGTRQTRTKFTGSSRREPCPVCGRAHSDNCRIGSDGLILCFRGSTCAPPTWAQQPGRDHGPGANGEHFAYLGETDAWAMFRLHRPLGQQERRRLVKRIVPTEYRPSWAAAAEGAPWVASPCLSHGESWDFFTEEPSNYRPSNWIVAALYQRHCLAMGWGVQP